MNELAELQSTMIDCGHSQHLVREKSLNKFKTLMLELMSTFESDEEYQSFLTIILNTIKLMITSRSWELRYGSIQIAVTVLHNIDTMKAGDVIDNAKAYLFEQSKELLKDEEFRVRNSIGDIMQKLIILDGSKVYDDFKQTLFDNINETFDRDPVGTDASSNMSTQGSINSLYDKPVTEEVKFENPMDMLTEKHPKTWGKKTSDMHDTEGWKSLETSMRLLQRMIQALGTDFLVFDFKEVTDVLLKAAGHLNRFVREITYFVIEELYKISEKCDEEHKQRFIELCKDLIPITAQGLSDNWSQVRFAASWATRSFYIFGKTNENLRQEYDTDMLPRMCLNRYYVAEGVRNYSLETWKIVVEDKGIDILITQAEAFWKYYIMQCLADNHAVREAAWHCISEICTKVASVNPEPFRPHINDLLGALIDWFKDQSWPVRDSACVSCGKFVQRFPEESSERKQELFDLWKAHLSDNIASVREHSAIALMDALEVYESEVVDLIKAELKDNLMKAKTDQQKDSQKFSGYSGTSVFSVAKPLEDGKYDEHADQQLYSCGSLAPKLKRGGGCMDHGFSRAKEPWEHTDGWIYLLRELSRTKKMTLVPNYLDSLSELCYIDHFKHAAHLKENIFKAIPEMINNMGKKFRPFLELFLDPLFRNLKNSNRLWAVAAEVCLLSMEKFYGQNIFKAILENENSKFTDEFLKIKSVVSY